MPKPILFVSIKPEGEQDLKKKFKARNIYLYHYLIIT